MTRSYAEQVESIERQMRQLRARRQEVAARHAKSVRKAQEAATFEVGRMALACFEGGWESVDFAALADTMRRNSGVIGSCRVPAGEADPDKSAARLREYQRARASATAVPADEGGDGHGRDED